MRCRQAQALLPLMLDGALPAPEESAVQAHVRRCPRCARVVRTVARPLPPLPPVPPQALEAMHRRLEGRLQTRLQAVAPPLPLRRTGVLDTIGRNASPLVWMSGILAGVTAAWVLGFVGPATDRVDTGVSDDPAATLLSRQEVDVAVANPPDGRCPHVRIQDAPNPLPPRFVSPATYLMTSDRSAFLGLRPIQNTGPLISIGPNTRPAARLDMDMPPWLHVSATDVQHISRTQ